MTKDSFLPEICSDFIDWEKRRIAENGFRVDMLRQNGARDVLDACLGDGCDTIELLNQGFCVSSNDIDPDFIALAEKNAKDRGMSLAISSYDWRKLGFADNSFDGVSCMGNSITYLFEREDRLQAVNEFRRVLRPDGILFIDARNYDYILDNRKDILQNGFNYSYKRVYCGKSIQIELIIIEDKKVVFEVTDTRSSKNASLELYPIRRLELEELINDAGFSQIEAYSDFSKGYDPHAEFYQFVARK